MKNTINIWKGIILKNEGEKQLLMLSKSLFTWGVSSTLLGLFSLIEFSTITFPVFVFIFLQLFISLSSIGIYEETLEISAEKALEKSDLLSNVFKVIASVLFYFIFLGDFPIHSVFISIGLCIWSYNAYKKKQSFN